MTTAGWKAPIERTRRVLVARTDLLLDLLREAREASVRGNGYVVDERFSDMERELQALKTKINQDWPFDHYGNRRQGRIRLYETDRLNERSA